MPGTYTVTLNEILKRTQAVSDASFRRARELQKTTGKKLIRIIVDEGMISEKDLLLLLSTELNIPVLNLSAYKSDPNVARLIPKKIADQHGIIPIAKIGNIITLAMGDPLDVSAMDDVKKITQCNVRPVIVSYRDIQAAIEAQYSEELKLEEILDNLDENSIEVVNQSETVEENHETYAADEAPVIKIVNLILHQR